jgi:aminobenzoyl-glutamate utilization protein A
MYGTEKTLQETGSATTTQSDGEIVDIIVDAARSMGTFAEIERDAAPGGSDDATWMMKRVQERGGKATYIILGSTLKAGHHNECFDFDETVLPMGVDLLYTVLRTLSKKQ